MMMNKSTALIASLVVAGLAAAVRGAPSCAANGPQSFQDIVINNPTGQLQTLEALVKAVDFGDGLGAEGPINVFLPIDSAFETILNSLNVTFDALLGQPELIKRLLQYHVVVDGAVCSGGLDGEVSTALPGQTLVVSDDGNSVTDGSGNTANVIVTVPASNGLGLVIDRVLLPIPDAEGDVPVAEVSGGPSQTQLKNLFGRIDVNRDGVVTVDELKAAAAFVGVTLTDEQLQQFDEQAPEGADLAFFLQSASALLADGGFSLPGGR